MSMVRSFGILILAVVVASASPGEVFGTVADEEDNSTEQLISVSLMVANGALFATNLMAITDYNGSWWLGTLGMAVGAGSIVWASNDQAENSNLVAAFGVIGAASGLASFGRWYQHRRYRVEMSVQPDFSEGRVAPAAAFTFRARF